MASQLNDLEFNKYDWDVIESKFTQDSNAMVQHAIDSFDDFILRKLEQTMEGFNPITLYHQFMPEKDMFKYQLTVNIKNPKISKPIINERDGSQKIMTPNEARQRNFTYSGTISSDVYISTSVVKDGKVHYENKVIKDVNIGKIPIMLRSNYCVLKEPGFQKQLDECKYDFGGYFIVNGNEKVIVSQDRISENKTFVFLDTKQSTYSHISEIRSVPDSTFGPPKLTSVKLSNKPNHFGRFIRASIHHVRTDIPIFILFRALGLTSDKEIVQYIAYDIKTPQGRLLASELKGSVDEASTVLTPPQALEYISKYLNVTGYPKEIMQNKEHRLNIVRDILLKEFLPHVGNDYIKKALYLGYMVNKLLRCFLGQIPLDDRDSYVNKRVDTPGILMANLFRQYYGKLVRDMKTMTYREINSGPWKATNDFINVINSNNIYKILKSTTIESGLKYSLATGNWGIRNNINKTKQGVAQVLNRLTYNATLSHLRRINTPMEKTGKLVQPRKLHSTQWGIICPAETPEGGSVGLVKNLSIMSTITIASDPTCVKELLHESGLIAFDGVNLDMFAKHTHVFVNGDLLGVHPEPQVLYETVKSWKRTGVINVYTGVFWNIQGNSIYICTDAGRCVRPLYIVDNGSQIRLTKKHILGIKKGDLSWNDFVSPMSSMKAAEYGITESIVEYIDVEESAHIMIAMKFKDLLKGQKGNMLPVKYTHLEVHPSLFFGVLGANIPFPDHNQAPRNCYQCLGVDELVLMSDGSKKAIKDVQVGDMVVSIHPETLQTSTTRVTGHFVRPNDRPVHRLTFFNGNAIVATEDHMFLTMDAGWQQVKDMQPGTRIHTYVQAFDDPIEDMAQRNQVPVTWLSTLVNIERVSDCDVADIEVESDNHSFITTHGLVSHNCAMGKQAIGIYATNFRNRMDTLANVLTYPQKPLVRTRMSDLIHCNEMPSGINAIVAIMTYTGYNQEDSVLMNKSAVERGLFNSTFYRSYKEQCIKNHSTGEEEIFCQPPVNNTKGLKPFNYDKLEEDGFVKENTYVETGDVLIGKFMPQKQKDIFIYKDNSVIVKNNEMGYVDRNCSHDRYFKNVNNDGYVFSKVRVRNYRAPVIGDKFASRMAQKGTLGMLYNQEDMPFTKDGIVPDIIMNPHAIPSRMTIAQLMECIMGKACVMHGTFGDSTPFTDIEVEDIAEMLEKAGMERYGNEIMYNPRTGEQISTLIFMGPTYYQRLKHMVTDKQHSRSASGPVVLLTRQPAEGRAREGGLRMGEMEVECNWAHGALQFLKERLMECSDNYRVFVCTCCGMISNVNPDKKIYKCASCKNNSSFVQVRIPYAAKLLFQEIQCLGIGAKFLTH